MRFEAAIFDLDGTLVDSEVLWIEAIRQAFELRGVVLPPDQLKALVYGRAWSDIYADIERILPGVYSSRAEVETVTEPIFHTLCRTRDIRIAPSVTMLRRLARQVPVAIVSGSTTNMVRQFVDVLTITDCVQLILGCDDYAPGKPDPAGFRLAAERLEVPPDACVVFEDSAAGVRAAKAAGMFCVALQQPGRPGQDVTPADVIVGDLTDAAPHLR